MIVNITHTTVLVLLAKKDWAIWLVSFNYDMLYMHT